MSKNKKTLWRITLGKNIAVVWVRKARMTHGSCVVISGQWQSVVHTDVDVYIGRTSLTIDTVLFVCCIYWECLMYTVLSKDVCTSAHEFVQLIVKCSIILTIPCLTVIIGAACLCMTCHIHVRQVIWVTSGRHRNEQIWKISHTLVSSVVRFFGRNTSWYIAHADLIPPIKAN